MTAMKIEKVEASVQEQLTATVKCRRCNQVLPDFSRAATRGSASFPDETRTANLINLLLGRALTHGREVTCGCKSTGDLLLLSLRTSSPGTDPNELERLIHMANAGVLDHDGPEFNAL